jgi:hypothetical protein
MHINKKKVVIFIIISVFLVTIFYNIGVINNNFLQTQEVDSLDSDILNDLNTQSTIFEGALDSLNITDYGNLYSINQEIQLDNQEDFNLSYYLDDVHDWSVSKIEHSVENIRDTRNWINNSEFESPTIYRVYDVFELDGYSSSHNPNWNNPESEIYKGDALYMRAHFANFSFELNYDFLLVANKDDEIIMANDSISYDIFTPWIPGDTLKIDYVSDINTQWDGYYIDYYEFINDTSTIGFEKWGFDFKKNELNGINNYGPGEIGGESAMFVAMYPEIDFDNYPPDIDYWYETGAFSEIYQNITLPRKAVIDASISFDYYCQFGLETNDNFIYVAMNDQKLYSIGMGDVVDLGKNEWHHSGRIPLDIWLNTSNIFDINLPEQFLNLSLGIKVATGWGYPQVDDVLQNVIWFDNVQLEITTIANATQSDIDLRIDNESIIDKEKWGSGELTLTNDWISNSIIQTISTSSPNLEFLLNTTLYGSKIGTSKYNQLNDEGTIYNIIDNNTIIWEFYHNFYMPSQYSDFEFSISKPENWQILSVLDPTFLSVPFEGGTSGDHFVNITKEYAKYPGWWKFQATSPNYLQEINTLMARNGEWGYNEFKSGDFAQIRTQVNNSGDVPLGLSQTQVNLTIYDPTDLLWYEYSATPLVDGNLVFPTIQFASENTTGGIYEYRLLWTNGTALGGYNNSFVVTHNSYLTLLEPSDAVFDNTTGGYVGELIPVRLYLRDLENNNSISGATVSFNWTSGTNYFTEGISGIYETVLHTSDLGAFGEYLIEINSNKIGFNTSYLILTINLGEQSGLQRLESDSKIELNSNSTIKFRYYSDVDEDGIEGALVSVNITNPSYYSITELAGGYYEIDFSTNFLPGLGIYRFRFNFESTGHESQEYVYQFEIISPVNPNGEPNYLLFLAFIMAIILSSVLGALSVRSYVYLPRKRRKQSDLLSRTQRYKDMNNIQAIVIIHKLSGIPLFSKSYSILEKQKKELFSGFIQAITTIGEEIIGGNDEKVQDDNRSKSETVERIIELDFKYFYCLICDRGELRIVLVLKNKASERIKEQAANLSLGLMLQISEQIENWDGSLDKFEQLIPPILNNYFELYYKEAFILNSVEYIAKVQNKNDMSKMEIRILNVIYSIAKGKKEIYLDQILEIVHEEDKNKVIDGLESLLKKNIIISTKN